MYMKKFYIFLVKNTLSADIGYAVLVIQVIRGFKVTVKLKLL